MSQLPLQPPEPSSHSRHTYNIRRVIDSWRSLVCPIAISCDQPVFFCIDRTTVYLMSPALLWRTFCTRAEYKENKKAEREKKNKQQDKGNHISFCSFFSSHSRLSFSAHSILVMLVSALFLLSVFHPSPTSQSQTPLFKFLLITLSLPQQPLPKLSPSSPKLSAVSPSFYICLPSLPPFHTSQPNI